MKSQVATITLGVENLQHSLTFYRDGLGLPTTGIQREGYHQREIAMFDMRSGLKLALLPRNMLWLEAGIEKTPSQNSASLALCHIVASKIEVYILMDHVERAGATIVKSAGKTLWGGYAGYFQDPDGHLWEIAWDEEVRVPRLPFALITQSLPAP